MERCPLPHPCAPRLSRFLLPPLFSDLQGAAEEGPVIIVNASQYSCDALIVLRDQDPVHIPIDMMRTDVSELSTEFQSVAEQFGCSDQQNKLVGILCKLWHHIVEPVVEALRVLNVRPGSRIWWCPTAEFTLLPLHAAGPYERERDNLPQIYISSYTPTLVSREPIYASICATLMTFLEPCLATLIARDKSHVPTECAQACTFIKNIAYVSGSPSFSV
jgi:hypothetical protein